MAVEVPFQFRVTGHPPVAVYLVVDSQSRDPIGHHILNGGFELTPAMTWLLSVVAPSDRVLDIGAHIGTVSLPLAARGTTVVAIEPMHQSAQLLRHAVEINCLGNVSVIEAAADAVSGEVFMECAGPYSNVTTAVSIEGTATTRAVKAIAIDDLECRADWMKLDVEGWELSVLLGARRTLRSMRGLVFESNGHTLSKNGASPEALLTAIRQLGFRVYEACDGYLRLAHRSNFQPETTIDYVAVRRGVRGPWKVRRRPRSQRQLADALSSELSHPVADHRAWARRAKARSPLGVRIWLALHDAR